MADTLEARARRLVELAAEIRDGMPYTNDEKDAVYYGAVFANAYLDTLAAVEESRGLLARVWDEDMARDHDEQHHDAIGAWLARHPSPKETP